MHEEAATNPWWKMQLHNITRIVNMARSQNGIAVLTVATTWLVQRGQASALLLMVGHALGHLDLLQADDVCIYLQTASCLIAA